MALAEQEEYLKLIDYSGISIVNEACLTFTTNLNELILFFWAQFPKEPLDVVIIKLVIWTSNQKHFTITHNAISGQIVHVSPDWGLTCTSISNSTLKVTAAKYLLHDAILQLLEMSVLLFLLF